MSYTDNQKSWHSGPLLDVLELLNTNKGGLSKSEVEKRLLYGKNIIIETKPPSLLTLFLGQFKSPLIYVLILAAIAVTFLGDITDSLIIFFVLLFNAFLGLFQENKANQTLKSLKQFSRGRAVVLRDDIETEIDDSDLVPGDFIILRGGDKVPADARLVNVEGLKVNESALTGESEPVEKNIEVCAEETPLPDRKNMIYKSTLIVSGEATAVVVSTGMSTFVGSIAEKLKDIDSEMPLKVKINKLSKQIGLAVLVSVLVIILIGAARDFAIRDIFFTSIAVAVSLIPEGLPIIITLILARGVYRMAKRNALIKNMQAVEALGQANIIAVDKTGTITKNELMVERVFIDGKDFKVLGSGFDPKGIITLKDKEIDPANHSELLFSGRVATYCASARVEYKEDGSVVVLGDPTEAALLVLGEKIGFRKEELESEDKQVFGIPFSFEHKFHTTVHKTGEKFLLSIVGAPESVISRVDKYRTGEEVREIDDEYLKVISDKIDEYSSLGLRIIAFAYHESNESSFDLEKLPKLVFGGLYAMADVLREEIFESIKEATNSGIKVVMITGDYYGTARALATQAGIFREGDRIISGTDINNMSVEELSKNLDNVSVFARVLPEHKLSIVEAYKLRGDIIGMTGDGVNDALSLQSAHLGISMGKGGTEVAKEASDIVLIDNNFRSIIAAIEEGRSIYSTIKKVLLYLISTSIGEFLSIAGAIALGFPLPISPSQILWLNVVTDGFFVIALAFEPNVSIKERIKMIDNTNLVNKNSLLRAGLMGFTMMIGTLVLFYFAYGAGNYKVWTLVLTLLVVFQWFNAWNCRSDKNSAFYQFWSNRYMVVALLGALALHLFAIYNPFMNKVLRVVPLDKSDWMMIIMIGVSILLVEEIRKSINNYRLRHLQRVS